MAEEEYLPQPPPERESNRDPLPARCPYCSTILTRVSIDEFRCQEHGIVRPYYGDRKDAKHEVLDP